MKNPAGDLPGQENLFNLEGFPLLDAEEAVKTMGGREILCEMLELMLNSSMDGDLSQIRSAHERKDWEKTQQIAHKIKGGAVYVGTVRMKMACQYLEQYWKTGQCELLEPLYQQCLQVIDESLKEVRHWLAENKS